MRKALRTKFILLILPIILIILDQYTKVVAYNKLLDGDTFNLITNVLEFNFTKNTGAAWGMLPNATWFFAIISIVISCAILFCYFKLPNEDKFVPLNILLLILLSGAIGNMIDRIVRGYVVDFIYFKLINFPIFNVADCYVTIGGILLAILLIFKYKEEDFTFLKSK